MKKSRDEIKNLKLNPFNGDPSLAFVRFFKNNHITIKNKQESFSSSGRNILYNITRGSKSGHLKINISKDFLINISINYDAHSQSIQTRVPEEAFFLLKEILVR